MLNHPQKRGGAHTRRLVLDHLLWVIFDVAVAVVKVLLPQAQAVERVTRPVVAAEEAV